MSLRHCFTFVALLTAASAIPACGGTEGDGPAPAPVPAPSADGGQASCNGLVNVASAVAIIAEPEDPPPAAGGSIADGTYVLTKATLYTGAGGKSGPTSSTIRLTAAFSGSDSQSIMDDVPRSATIERVGNELVATTTCPGTGTDKTLYSATPTSLALYLVDSKGTRVYSLEKL